MSNKKAPLPYLFYFLTSSYVYDETQKLKLKLINHNRGIANIPNVSHLENEQTNSAAYHNRMDISKDCLSCDFVDSIKTV